ncbi:PREDICTED: adipocyte plasma membrane-associated protein-like isoform X1 [Priapulus caudatus]|uniref:Adipocyte plasma membrane-associated protein-like isoform X1 n=1 Tax=Priapulus caudatus TaxID=37621 RepID=A0ABM1DTI5_PRICU|nr:PREDICTED: adipocyte plasma membrane-associated protein-like isoform X1 [Priapulus caudatus]
MLRQRGKAHDKRPVISDLAATLDEIPPIQPDIHEEAERSHTVLLSAYSEPGSPWVSIISVLLLTVVVIPLSFIGLIDMLISSPIEPDRYRMLNPAPLDGVLEANDWLQTSEKLYEGTLERPTAMFAHEGYLYVGSVNNKILRFKNGKNETLHKRNVPCDAVHSEAECGRLQSISLTPAGDLLILDAYKGLYLVNMSTENREVVMLADTFELVEGAKLNYLTDMTVTSKGVLYFTDHSSKFDRMNAIYAWMDKSTGRLLAQGPNLKSSVPHFIFKELHSPSSLCMSPSEEFLLIAEAGKARILRCVCFNCQTMTTARECVCCAEIPEVVAKIGEAQMTNVKCITDHPGMQAVCLDPWSVQVAWFAYHQQYRGNAFEGPMHAKYRHIAYRQLVRWCFGYLARDTRVVLPACAVSCIPAHFPPPDEEPYASSRDFTQQHTSTYHT